MLVSHLELAAVAAGSGRMDSIRMERFQKAR